MLCLEWEPDLIALSLLYLSCRLLKFNVTDWVDKPAGYTGRWYQCFLRDVTLDIIEGERHGSGVRGGWGDVEVHWGLLTDWFTRKFSIVFLCDVTPDIIVAPTGTPANFIEPNDYYDYDCDTS